jgi:hypothetical protein
MNCGFCGNSGADVRDGLCDICRDAAVEAAETSAPIEQCTRAAVHSMHMRGAECTILSIRIDAPLNEASADQALAAAVKAIAECVGTPVVASKTTAQA